MSFLSTKTEYRRKWEESLPERGKVLRLHLQVLKAGIKRDKEAMKRAFDEGDKAFFKRSVNARNVVIRAIKHEIYKTEYAKLIYKNEGCAVCSFCHDLLIDEGYKVKTSDKYCSQCGHKINWGARVYEKD